MADSKRQLTPDEVDEFDELLTEALDDFANPNLLHGALSRDQQQQQQQKHRPAEAVSAGLRENASTADLLKPLAGLSLDAGGAASGVGSGRRDSGPAAGDADDDEGNAESDAQFDHLMSRLEADFRQLDGAVQALLKPSAEDDNDPEVRRLKEELRGFADKVDTADPAELGEALVSTLRNLDESVSAHSRHTDAMHLPKPQSSSGGGGAGGSGGSNTEEVLMPFMENLMHTLLSKDVIYPSLKAIRDAYPAWLERNASALSSGDVEAARKRMTVIGQVCEQYEALGDAKPSDDQFDSILRLVQQMQALGPPPEELLGDKDLPSVMPQCPQM